MWEKAIVHFKNKLFMTKNQWQYLLPCLCISLLIWSSKVLAHGSNIEYRQTTAIEIQANYDNNQPMANAQVIVYSSENPTKPWLKGTTDEKGRFTFTPDPNQQGSWDVKVRKAGHGNIVTIAMDEEGLIISENSNYSEVHHYTPLQKAFLGLAGTWGFVGTALFFTRRKTE